MTTSACRAATEPSLTLGRNDYISGDGSLATFPGASAARLGNGNNAAGDISPGRNAACTDAVASIKPAAAQRHFTHSRRMRSSRKVIADNPSVGS